MTPTECFVMWLVFTTLDLCHAPSIATMPLPVGLTILPFVV